jgi:uncharacterized protein YjbI with pentapeptide repeats
MGAMEEIEILKKGVPTWNEWRSNNPHIHRPNLNNADLTGIDLRNVNLRGAELREAEFHAFGTSNPHHADLRGADFYGANLVLAKLGGADLREVDFSRADLSGARVHHANLTGARLRKTWLNGTYMSMADLTDADLTEASLMEADLTRAVLAGTCLRGANLSWAIVRDADFQRADLTGASLLSASMTSANFEFAKLNNCRVYGASAWNLNLEGAEQTNLIITTIDEPAITVDNLEIAQFIYLLLNNRRVRQVIDILTSKVVLILGRFTVERKAVLEAIREELRRRNYLPVLFDFDPAMNQARMETVSTLAHMARFIIADITDAKTVLQELQAIVPTRPSLPVQPILLSGQNEPGVFDFFRLYPWFLRTVYYETPELLIASLERRVIEPAEAAAKELIRRIEDTRSKPDALLGANEHAGGPQS